MTLQNGARGHLLLVDDERWYFEDLCGWVGERYTVTHATSCAEARDYLRSRSFQVILADMYLGDGSGLDVLREALRCDPTRAVVVVSQYAGVSETVAALKSGAYSFMKKAEPPDYQLEVIDAAFRWTRRHRELAEFRNRYRADLEHLIADDPAVQAVLRRLEQLARDPSLPVLLHGEAGVGKSLLACWLHDRTPVRTSAAFCSRSCRGLTAGALFGAVQSNGELPVHGILDVAAAGTVHLRNLQCLHRGLQEELAEVLRHQLFTRCGGGEEVSLESRLVFSVIGEVEAMAGGGRIDPGLFDLLRMTQIRVPPLRERRTDLDLFISRVSSTLGEAYGLERSLTRGARVRLRRHRWPGNIWELESVLRVAFCRIEEEEDEEEEEEQQQQQGEEGRDGGAIGADIIEAILGPDTDSDEPPEPLGPDSLTAQMQAAEKGIIERALAATGGNVAAAARRMGISRAVLHKKINRRRIQVRRPGRDDS